MAHRNKRPHGRRAAGKQSSARGTGAGPVGGSVWIWGNHAVVAALANPDRVLQRIVVTNETAPTLPPLPRSAPEPENLSPGALGALLPAGAVHQGLALLSKPLENLDITEACEVSREARRSVVLVLDQVTDPRNVGAILRSAAAFGVRAIVTPAAHSAPETGALAKAASGALERVPLVRVSNLARALDQLADLGYWRVGLDSEARKVLRAEDHPGHVALVLGAEGAGMRRLTAERCDERVKLVTNPAAGATGSLNVSVAASVALYEFARSPRVLP